MAPCAQSQVTGHIAAAWGIEHKPAAFPASQLETSAPAAAATMLNSSSGKSAQTRTGGMDGQVDGQPGSPLLHPQEAGQNALYFVSHQTFGSRNTCLHPRARTADRSLFLWPIAAINARNSGESVGVSVHCRSLIWRSALARHEGAQPELGPMFTNGLKAPSHPHVTGHQSRARRYPRNISLHLSTSARHICQLDRSVESDLGKERCRSHRRALCLQS